MASLWVMRRLSKYSELGSEGTCHVRFGDVQRICSILCSSSVVQQSVGSSLIHEMVVLKQDT